MNSKNDTVSLYMTLLFIFMQKTIFIKNSKNFRFAHFLGKSNYFFKKKKKKERKKERKKNTLFWALFIQIWARWNFPQKLSSITF